ncbi:DUF885 domain-containing protein [Cuneatibacter caecimuris]|uniref:Uncharacterized protein (DUF885 family) n=1 Tax=Cuneatibacter caecimuris TaxID=1796618 RepID=A0A4Q7P3R3_9FIRM|nr:DUF885 domain-containing protein [Cuneatibacter caecimuris]RZS94038.1 uncharacterized protein (DUF885 family) [Cuneatibacter caecimuris]
MLPFLSKLVRQKHFIGITALCLTIALVAVSALSQRTREPASSTAATGEAVTNVKPEDSGQAFAQFTQAQFQEAMLADSVNLNYSLADPSLYGIPADTPAAISSSDPENIQKGLEEMKGLLDQLHAFSYDNLDQDQKITYDMMEDYLQLELSAKDLYLYDELLGSTTGLQAQYPVVLSEFSFRCKEDIRRYLDYLKLLPQLFQEVVSFEQAKSSAGLFMSNTTAKNIISQCQAFIASPSENLLISTFDSRLEDYNAGDITAAEAAEYRKENREVVEKYVISAYQTLIDGLTALLGTGVHEGGLCQLPSGKEYYSYLLQQKTGSRRTVEEIRTLMTSYLDENLRAASALMAEHPELADEYQAAAVSLTAPEAILQDLQKKISEDFPALPETTYTVKYVHDSLKDFLSPAFYLTPPLDDYRDNVIYINQAQPSMDLYTTLAHEGYPGHLFQNVYFRAQNPNPLRDYLGVLGYAEGWATYVEHLSYHYIDDYSENLASFLSANHMATLGIYALCDLGINYDGWSVAQTADFLARYYSLTGSQLAEISQEIYSAMVDDPANYPAYYVGCLEILELKKEQQAALGENFSLKAFHQRLLEIGPAPFPVLKKYFTAQ